MQPGLFNFEGEYRARYNDIMRGLVERGVIKHKDGRLYTTVKP